MAKNQVLGFKPAPGLEQSTMKIPSECRTGSIGPR
jgi:hypothetical protein